MLQQARMGAWGWTDTFRSSWAQWRKCRPWTKKTTKWDLLQSREALVFKLASERDKKKLQNIVRGFVMVCPWRRRKWMGIRWKIQASEYVKLAYRSNEIHGEKSMAMNYGAQKAFTTSEQMEVKSTGEHYFLMKPTKNWRRRTANRSVVKNFTRWRSRKLKLMSTASLNQGAND